MSSSRKRYSHEFKLEVIRRVQETGRSQDGAQDEFEHMADHRPGLVAPQVSARTSQ